MGEASIDLGKSGIACLATWLLFTLTFHSRGYSNPAFILAPTPRVELEPLGLGPNYKMLPGFLNNAVTAVILGIAFSLRSSRSCLSLSAAKA